MVEMTFEPEMLEARAKMKGKTFRSYEGRFPVPASGVIPDRVRFNLGSFSVDLKCWYKDMAVAIRTKRRVCTFSRDVWFSTAFTVAEGDDIEVEYSELECAEGWAGEPDEGEPPVVKVTRTITVL